MKKVLIVASVISFIEWFNKENLEFLQNEMSCEVHIACNFEYMNDTDEIRTKKYINNLKEKGFVLHNIKFARNPLVKENIKAYFQLKTIIYENKFDLIHCHTPTVSMMTRIVSRKARKKGSVVIYTCHGFHFHSSSPKKNWIIYYPVERILSRYCDYIVTINMEDFKRAKTFYTSNVRYIPGVGVDIKRIQDVSINKAEYKKKIGIPFDGIMLLSIGELIERKNHEVIIRALAKLQSVNIYYVICGKGPLEEYLVELSKQLGIEEYVIFLGFRNDIPQLLHAADISALPSKIEGLGLAGIEAMSAGVPLVSSNVHGIIDYVINGKTGFSCSPNDVNCFAKSIEKLVSNKGLRESMSKDCMETVEPYEINNALHAMWDIYREIL